MSDGCLAGCVDEWYTRTNFSLNWQFDFTIALGNVCTKYTYNSTIYNDYNDLIENGLEKLKHFDDEDDDDDDRLI